MCVLKLYHFCCASENQESAEGGKLPRPRSQSLGTGVAGLCINSINSLVSSNSCILGRFAENQHSLIVALLPQFVPSNWLVSPFPVFKEIWCEKINNKVPNYYMFVDFADFFQKERHGWIYRSPSIYPSVYLSIFSSLFVYTSGGSWLAGRVSYITLLECLNCSPRSRQA